MLDTIKIENMIYIIRGKQVMMAADVAKIYNSETKIINQVVKRNINRFPSYFCFQLTQEEYDDLKLQNMNSKDNSLRSQIVTSKELSVGRGGNRYLPYVFTEYGVIMLSSLLKSDIAAEVNVRVIDAFVKMRHYVIENKDVYKSLNNINNKIIEHDEKLNFLFSKFDKKEKLFLPGEVYDAYSEMLDIVSNAKDELIIIDSYADKNLLDIIKNVNCSVIVITSFKTKITDICLINLINSIIID